MNDVLIVIEQEESILETNGTTKVVTECLETIE